MTARPAEARCELLIERRFSAPVEQVFRLWSDTALRRRWWGPADFVCTALDSDFRPGGAWSATIRSDALGPYGMSGTYSEIVANARIVFSFRWSDDPPGFHNTVEVTFRTTADGGTLQSFWQGPFPTTDSRDSHIGGWNECLDRLAAATQEIAR
jgi:uncharacterized protein YndB with AHSA1/START domain